MNAVEYCLLHGLKLAGEAHPALLSAAETLSYGQLAEIDRVERAYPHLDDTAFVAENRDDCSAVASDKPRYTNLATNSSAKLMQY